MRPLTLAELIARGSLIVNDGYRTKKSEHGQPGFPILRVAEVLDGSIRPTLGDHVREEFEDKIGSKLSHPGDVLLTTKGTVGRRAIMPPATPSFAYSPQLCFFRVLDQSIDARWLYYWLGSEAFWSQATGVSQQTDMAPYISLRDLRQVQIALPSVEEQSGIAATLGAIDDKIKSNQRLIEKTTELAMAMLSFGDNKVRVGDVASFVKGLSYNGAGLDDGTTMGSLPMLNLGNFSTSGRIKADATKYYIGAFKPQHRLAARELVIANTDLTQAREILGRGFLVPPRFEGAIHTHHTSVVRFHRDPWISLFLWAQLQTPEFRKRAQGFATGTTVTALPKEALLEFEVTVPQNGPQVFVEALHLLELVWQRDTECDHLASTRDALLPELLSGRIRVPEAEMTMA